MRFATFNVFWLGTPERRKIERRPEDLAAIAEVIARLDADVLLLQEVVSGPVLDEVLAMAGTATRREYVARDEQGHYLTTGRMRRRTSHIQKIVLAYDTRTVLLQELQRAFTDRNWPGPRAPLVARFSDRASRFACTLVGVHLKSGMPGEPGDAPEAIARAGECTTLANWLESGTRRDAGRGGPKTEAVVVLGDFNAERDHPSLRPLDRLLGSWTWHRPIFAPTPPSSPDSLQEHWTSFGSRTIIDHALTSPAATARVQRAPRIYPFDLDPSISERFEANAPGGELYLRRKTDLSVQFDDELPPQLVENLFRVSDHRPLSIDLTTDLATDLATASSATPSQGSSTGNDVPPKPASSG